jgi:two-component system cell cycle sensor histidine kinase/response regulator CckA
VEKKQTIRILIIEDYKDDVLLMVRHFTKAGLQIEYQVAASAEQMQGFLKNASWDLVISDYALPGFDGLAALKILHKSKQDIPFIIVSGAIGEETAVAAMKAGAHDYIMKDELSRLVPAIRRELNEADERRSRRRIQKDLKESEERYRILAENVTDVIWTMNLEFNFTYISPSVERILGYTVKEAMALPLRSIVTRHSLDRAIHTYRKLLSMMHQPEDNSSPISSLELQLIDKSGKLLWTEISISFLLNKSKKPFGLIGTTRDITQRKNLEEKIIESQKMEAINRLAGGVAHDFNNLLTVIKGYCELGLLKVSKLDPLYQNFEQIHRATERAGLLTNQLLAFSRRQVLKPVIVNPNKIMGEMKIMLKRIIGEDIELITLLNPDIGNIRVDAGQIEQVIMNLAVNARDAMPRGGQLIIETANIHIDKVIIHDDKEIEVGPYIVLKISDTGEGMDAHTKSHVFEPFFTTKKETKGTGLGMATVYGIVKQSGGFIELNSKLKKGTQVTIYFPQIDQPAEKIEKTEIRKSQMGGKETILVVEDEEVVRDLISNVLRMHGYTVLEAAQAGDALLIFEKQGKIVDMVITDIVMPRMNGKELADRIRKKYKNMKVLFMSGYSDTIQISKSDENYLQKPFQAAELAKLVRQILDG